MSVKCLFYFKIVLKLNVIIVKVERWRERNNKGTGKSWCLCCCRHDYQGDKCKRKVEVCDEIQASWKALVYICYFVSDQWLLGCVGTAPPHIITIPAMCSSFQGELKTLFMLNLKQNALALLCTPRWNHILKKRGVLLVLIPLNADCLSGLRHWHRHKFSYCLNPHCCLFSHCLTKMMSNNITQQET